MAQNYHREDIDRASAVDYREQMEAADHKTMFRITDSLIGSRASMASVLPKIIDKADIPSMFADLNDDGCAVLPGFDSFRTLPFDNVKN